VSSLLQKRAHALIGQRGCLTTPAGAAVSLRVLGSPDSRQPHKCVGRRSVQYKDRTVDIPPKKSGNMQDVWLITLTDLPKQLFHVSIHR
jgi:hypothetical protein